MDASSPAQGVSAPPDSVATDPAVTAPRRKAASAAFWSEGVMVWRDRRWVALVPAWLTLVYASIQSLAHSFAPVGDAVAWGHRLAWVVLVGAPLTALILLWQRLRAPRPAPATVRFGGADGADNDRAQSDRIVVERSSSVCEHRLTAKRQGWFRARSGIGFGDAPYEVSLVLVRGQVLSIAVEDPGEARALLAAAGVDANCGALRTALCEAGPWTWALRLRRRLRLPAQVYAPALFGVIVGIHLVPPAAGLALFAVLSFVAAVLVGEAIAKRLDEPRVTVGDDGILVEGLRHRRFIPIEQLARADADDQGVTLTLDDFSTIVLPIAVGDDAAYLNEPAAQDARRANLMEQLRRAVERYGASAHATGILASSAVARRGRPLAAWSRAAREALGRDYRTASFTSEALLAVVASAHTPREQRIGAALALAQHDVDGEISDRIRIAIDSCADPDLEAALEAASSENLTDLHVSRALRAEVIESPVSPQVDGLMAESACSSPLQYVSNTRLK